jgi:hypothetical protein
MGDYVMNLSNAVTACRHLFKVQQFLAHGIIPALRIEDVKIALAKQINKNTDQKQRSLTEGSLKEYFDSYTVLTDYIKQHNLEVFLALESYSGTSSDGYSYLFPHSDNAKTIPVYHSSLVSKKDLYFNGAIPPRKLRLGTFLYYRGLISYYHLMESIAWQKDRRPLIGQMAMQIGKLTSDEFARIIVHVKNGECFGAVARKQDLLSPSVIASLVKAQEKYDCRIGRYFIEKNILSEKKLLKIENEMKLHNQKFG